MVAGFTVMVWQSMTSVYARVPKHALPSVARTVMGKLPVWVGVPEKTPVVGFRVIPVGSAPVTDHAMVPIPPVWVTVCE